MPPEAGPSQGSGLDQLDAKARQRRARQAPPPKRPKDEAAAPAVTSTERRPDSSTAADAVPEQRETAVAAGSATGVGVESREAGSTPPGPSQAAVRRAPSAEGGPVIAAPAAVNPPADADQRSRAAAAVGEATPPPLPAPAVAAEPVVASAVRVAHNYALGYGAARRKAADRLGLWVTGLKAARDVGASPGLLRAGLEDAANRAGVPVEEIPVVVWEAAGLVPPPPRA